MLVDLPAMPAYPIPMTPPKEPITILTQALPKTVPPPTRAVNEELLAIADHRIEECKVRLCEFFDFISTLLKGFFRKRLSILRPHIRRKRSKHLSA